MIYMVHNREEFNDLVRRELEDYKEKTLQFSTMEEVFDNAYKIAEFDAIGDYLLNADDEDVEELYPYASRIVGDLYDFEQNYAKPQWSNWDDLYDLVRDYLACEM